MKHFLAYCQNRKDQTQGIAMKNKSPSHKIDPLYADLYEEDKKYGGKRLERPQSEISKKRPLKNLKKAWMEHVDDFDEVDDFYEH